RHDDAADGRRDVLLGGHADTAGYCSAVHFFYRPPEQSGHRVFLQAGERDGAHQALLAEGARLDDPRCIAQAGLIRPHSRFAEWMEKVTDEQYESGARRLACYLLLVVGEWL